MRCQPQPDWWRVNFCVGGSCAVDIRLVWGAVATLKGKGPAKYAQHPTSGAD